MSAHRQKSHALSQVRDLARLALSAGDAPSACRILVEALMSNARDAPLRVDLAACLEIAGDPNGAARELSHALRIDPLHSGAAQRLSSLLSRHRLAHPGAVDGKGLRAALACEDASQQPLVDAAFALLASVPPLGPAVVRAAQGAALDAARGLVLTNTSEALQSDLLLLALSRGLNRSVVLERLLAALRRVIMIEADPSRFGDRALFALALALAGQLRNNEYVWPVPADEQAKLDTLPVDRAALCEGDFEAGRRLLLHALYRSPVEVLGPAPSADAFRNVRPKALRQFVHTSFAEHAEEKAIAQGLRRIGAIDDAVSVKVAGQYEARPYPRWISLEAPNPGSQRTKLECLFSPQTLAFMDRPFRVLIAGAGTSQHAIGSAIAYGPSAQVTALDLSSASLAYGQRMARKLGVPNIDFVVGDILNSGDLTGPFDVIECVGVLHHMAEPFAAWRRLLGCLATGGLMCVGLYSSIARRPLAALRSQDGFPGASPADDAVRRFRSQLLSRTDDATVAWLSQLGDFYSLSGFRDLVVHEHEVTMTLPEIARFLDDAGLRFHGFDDQDALMPAFSAAFPDEPFPGLLAHWARLEEAHPLTFEGMYQLWVSHAAAPDPDHI